MTQPTSITALPRHRDAGRRLNVVAGGAGFIGSHLCRALLDRAYFVPEDEAGGPYPQDVRDALADVVATLARATRSAAAAASPAEPPTSRPSRRASSRTVRIDSRSPTTSMRSSRSVWNERGQTSSTVSGWR